MLIGDMLERHSFRFFWIALGVVAALTVGGC